MLSTSRRAVASYPSYAEAERAVDSLSDRRFPVERTAIVGRDLEYVEQVTGRMSYGAAALRGALTGAFVGFLVGWLFGLFDWFDPIVSASGFSWLTARTRRLAMIRSTTSAGTVGCCSG